MYQNHIYKTYLPFCQLMSIVKFLCCGAHCRQLIGAY